MKKDDGHSLPADEVMDREEQQRRTIQEYIFHLEESQDLAEELALVQEENLEYTVSLLRATLESTADGILVVDLKGRIVSYNQRFADMWGIPEEVLAQHNDKLALAYVLKQFKYPEAFLARVRDLYNRPDDQSFDIIEFLDGRIFERYSQPQSIEDRIVGRVWSFRDVTERTRLEEARRKAHQELQAIIQASPLSIFTLDQEGKVLLWNQASEKTFGWSEAEAVGRILPIVPEDKMDEFRDNLQRALSGESLKDMELRRRRKDWTPIDLRIYTSTLYDSQGKATGVMAMNADITDYKRVEAEKAKLEAQLIQAQKMEAIGTLAGGIAHDFNNILTAIIGNISLAILDTQMEEQTRERLNQAEKACLRAQNLSKQLLTFSRGGAPIKEVVSVKSLITESASFACRGSQVNYESSLPDDLWAVEVDPGQISQVFQNVVINAIQAMPTGGVIKIRGENLEVAAGSDFPIDIGRYVKISIQDEGIGISADHLSRIFDPYFTTKQKGSGLGLATSYSIMKNHHGHISVESELGIGTTFNVYLPASDRRVIQQPNEDSGLISGKGKILVMDDELMVQEVLGKMLLTLGYEVKLAKNGAEAIEIFSQSEKSGDSFAAVILDLTVPGGMGGKEAMMRILKIDAQVKAIVSSGYSDNPIMADFQKYGFTAVIAKPYKISELGKVLDKALTGKE